MPKKDINQLAKFLVDQATGEAEHAQEETARVKASRKGGVSGGAARAKALTPEQRAEIAKLAANARWKKA
jgi:Spy/CpxP family protein refolding chaperone